MIYTLVSYAEIGDDQDKYVFHSSTKRGVVALMKTIMDNFDPAHVDIIKDFEKRCKGEE